MRKSSFTYKQKFIGVILAFILLGFASYKKTYKHIIDSYSQIESLNKKLDYANNSSFDIVLLKNELRNLDEIIGGQSDEPLELQEEILNFITQNFNYRNISKIEDTHLSQDNSFKVYTNIIEIEGDFFELIKILYEIEKNFEYSKVTSCQFISKKDFSKNTKNLYLKLIFQNYEKIK